MKIGILTFHWAHNYGAVLQCYALQEILKESHDVCVLNYVPPRTKSKRNIRWWLVFFTTLVRSTIRYIKFRKFIKRYLNVVPFKKCDLYVIGSDQVWNKKLTGGYRGVYFGTTSGKTISYAASAELSALDYEDRKHFRNKLNNFDVISVRESNLVSLLQPLTDKKVHHVLDPTLLAGRNVFDRIAVTPKIKTKYVLVYQVRNNKRILTLAKDIAKNIGGTVIQLSSRVSPRYIKGKYQCASPQEFVGWFKNSSYVVTTSYHGICFSLLYEVPFYTMRLGHNETRIESLLDLLGLNDRFVDEFACESIDYDRVNKILDEHREKSKYVLKHV